MQEDDDARIDLPFAQGTLLTSKYIDIKVVEGANPCKNSVAGSPPASSGDAAFNGITFLKETGSEPAAGNVFDWEVYSAARPTNACVSIGFVLRSSSPGAYSTPPPAFDRAAESAVFAVIMSTFAWMP
ncbi:MAG: hypothetical protein B6D40_12820 [Anaerolineae bacterium UTCFX3]|nr:MAG: hypothetical protein B6D40_12820 [Anaerolineae bacterium UTCFX3]